MPNQISMTAYATELVANILSYAPEISCLVVCNHFKNDFTSFVQNLVKERGCSALNSYYFLKNTLIKCTNPNCIHHSIVHKIVNVLDNMEQKLEMSLTLNSRYRHLKILYYIGVDAHPDLAHFKRLEDYKSEHVYPISFIGMIIEAENNYTENLDFKRFRKFYAYAPLSRKRIIPPLYASHDKKYRCGWMPVKTVLRSSVYRYVNAYRDRCGISHLRHDKSEFYRALNACFVMKEHVFIDLYSRDDLQDASPFHIRVLEQHKLYEFPSFNTILN